MLTWLSLAISTPCQWTVLGICRVQILHSFQGGNSVRLAIESFPYQRRDTNLQLASCQLLRISWCHYTSGRRHTHSSFHAISFDCQGFARRVSFYPLAPARGATGISVVEPLVSGRRFTPLRRCLGLLHYLSFVERTFSFKSSISHIISYHYNNM